MELQYVHMSYMDYLDECKPNINLLPFTNTKELIFMPQGIVMTFYGTTGLLLSAFLLATIQLNVGGGYNLYDKKNKKIEIFRLGFPGKKKEICLS